MKKSFILAVVLCILLTGCGKNVSEFEGENDAINTQIGDKTEVHNTENGVEKENNLIKKYKLLGVFTSLINFISYSNFTFEPSASTIISKTPSVPGAIQLSAI